MTGTLGHLVQPGRYNAAVLSAAPPLWSPASLSPVVWLTAGPTWCFTDAGATTPCGDGDLIYTWVNRGSGGNFVQATSGLRPTLRSTGGRWHAEFDGSNDQIRSASAGLGSLPLTLAMRLARLSATGGYNVFASSDSNMNACGIDNVQKQFLYGSTGFERTCTYDTSFHTWTFQANGASSLVRQDGSQLGAVGTSDAIFATMNVSTNGTLYYQQNYAGIIGVASSLSASEMSLVEAYLTGLMP